MDKYTGDKHNKNILFYAVKKVIACQDLARFELFLESGDLGSLFGILVALQYSMAYCQHQLLGLQERG